MQIYRAYLDKFYDRPRIYIQPKRKSHLYREAYEVKFGGIKMVTISDIIRYVTNTPENINKAILRQLLLEFQQAEPPAPVTNLDEFVAALEKGGDIIIEGDFSLTDNLVVDKDAYIDLNGHVINCGNKQIKLDGSNLTFEGDGSILAVKRGIGVYEGELTINGPTITSTNDCAIEVTGDNSIVTFNRGLITAQEVGILATSGSTVTMNGGTVRTVDNFCIGGNGNHGNGGTTITINGGKLEGHITSAGYVACGIYHPQDGILNITGGEIEGVNGCGVLMRAGVLNMSGGTVIGTGESGMKGKVGDSSVTVGPNGVIYDQSAHYPDNQNLAVNITNGTVMGVDASVDILKDEDHEAKVTISDSATLIPPLDETVIYDGGGVEGN